MADIESIDKENETKKQIVYSYRLLCFLRVTCFIILLLLSISMLFANCILIGILLIILSYKLYAIFVFTQYLKRLKASEANDDVDEEPLAQDLAGSQLSTEFTRASEPTFSQSDFAVLFFENEMRRLSLLSLASLPDYDTALEITDSLEKDENKDNFPPPSYEDATMVTSNIASLHE